MDPQKVTLTAQLFRLSALGINFAVCIFVGLGLGWLLQRYLHWGNWVVITGILFGVVTGFTETILELKRLVKSNR